MSRGNLMHGPFNTCRLCGQSDFVREDGRPQLFKYGVRHYAHAKCALERWGADFFTMIPAHLLSEFPALIADDFGALPKLEAALRAAGRLP